MSPYIANTLESARDFPFSIRWAAHRLMQKLELADDRQSIGTRLLYIRRTIPILLITSAVFIAASHFVGAIAVLPTALLWTGAAVGTVGIAYAVVDLIAMSRHRCGDPVNALRTFVAAVVHRRHNVAYQLITEQDRNGVIRSVPDVSGMSQAEDDVVFTFEELKGFSAYWDRTLSDRRPEDWEDSYHFLSYPLQWITWNGAKVRRFSDRLAFVQAEVTVHFLPSWTLLSLLLLIPAFTVIPAQRQSVRLRIRKTLVKTNGRWALVNGELRSTEDLVGTKLNFH